MKFDISAEFRERFREALESLDKDFVVNALSGENPADIADFLQNFTIDQYYLTLSWLPEDVQAEIVRELTSDWRAQLLPRFSAKQIAQFLNSLASDDAADILNEVPIEEQEAIIPLLNEGHRAKVLDLMRYPENVAGGLMAKEFVKIRGDWTVVQCVREIRKRADNINKIYVVYVVDGNDKLLGQISLQQLILADLRTHVKEMIDTEPISVETHMEDKEVAALMRRYDLEVVPVVQQGRLVGVITIDDVVDVLTEQADEERQIMAGITQDVEEADTVWHNIRARLPWLLIGIVGGMVNARFMGIFESHLMRITAIAFFVPLIQSTGGNVGIQSSSLVVQTLAGDGLVAGRLWKRLGKVLSVAICNGLLLASIVFMANVIIYGDQRLSFVVSLSLFSVVIFASCIGTVIPLILKRFGFNPALASGPFITTVNDLLGLSIYFFTIHLLL